MMQTLKRAAILAASACGVVFAAFPAHAQSIKAEKYTLPNGLTVILHEDHALPIATVNLWYKVGAKEEPPGRSGFAHLFEHLMFMGTERMPGNDFDVIMESGGGSNNATTSLDRTNYFSTGPSALLPTLLWLDADRMEDVGRTMTLDKLNKQLDVVRNEIRQNVENTPYGQAEEVVYRLMYPDGHPYHNAVYGTHADLQAATTGDVKTFFGTFYVPSNCSLVVAGDFEPSKIKPIIASLYGTLPTGAKVVHRDSKDWPMPALNRVIRSTIMDKVEQPRIDMVYHSPAGFAEGDAEMDLAGALLTQGKSSPLYKRLVIDEQLASDVGAYQASASLSSLFYIQITALPGADLERIETIADEEISKLSTDGPAQADLDARKAGIEMAFLARLDNIATIADKLNEYEYHFGNPDSFKRDLDRWRNATPASVKQWAARTLQPASRLVLRTLPEAPERKPSPRDEKPKALAATRFDVPRPDGFTMPSGIRVLVWNRPALPLVSTTVLVRPEGSIMVDPSKAGLVELTADMLDEGAGDKDAVAFSQALQAIGADFGASAGYDHMLAGITSLKRVAPQATSLLADAVLRPRMTESDFERVKRLHLDDLNQALADPPTVASRAAIRYLLGDKHPYGTPVSGTLKTVEPLTLAEVKQLRDAVVSPKSLTILISGDITTEEARSLLEPAFGSLAPSTVANPAPYSGGTQTFVANDPRRGPQNAQGLLVAVVDRPDAVQTVIRFALPNVNFADPRRVYRRTLNTVFGGSFTSRLNQNLREDHGYTYGAGSSFQMMSGGGLFIASSSVKADVTGEAVKEFLHEFGRIRGSDISPQEGAKAQETMRTNVIEGLQGVHGPISSTLPYLIANMPAAQLGEDFNEIAKADGFAINRIATEAIPLDRGVLVLVGDKTLILNQIKDLNLGNVVELSPEGEPMPAASATPGS